MHPQTSPTVSPFDTSEFDSSPHAFALVLRPLNVKAKVILVMKPGAEKFQRPMFDIKVGLDEISLNINRDQVMTRRREEPLTLFLLVSHHSSIPMCSTCWNFKIISV